MTSQPARVIHFVSGGFSGATSVAIALARHASQEAGAQTWLVLRRKRGMPLHKVDALRQEGLNVEVVAGWPHWRTIWHLKRLCDRIRPDVVFAHGFSEHLDGRYAALWAKVPAVHVEHNSRERYTPWRLAQARWLARRTAFIVGCSEGVTSNLAALGFPKEKLLSISNGIRLERFAREPATPLDAREQALVMTARFSGQKDHATLLRALAELKRRGLEPTAYLAGTGRAKHEARARRLCADLGLQGQVKFLGHHDDVPGLLLRSRVCVLSTHYEGMPLALLEGMAAGCVVVGSAVVGVKELITNGEDGLLARSGDPVSLADALQTAFDAAGGGQSLALRAREKAFREHGVETMFAAYGRLIERLRSMPHRAS